MQHSTLFHTRFLSSQKSGVLILSQYVRISAASKYTVLTPSPPPPPTLSGPGTPHICAKGKTTNVYAAAVAGALCIKVQPQADDHKSSLSKW